MTGRLAFWGLAVLVLGCHGQPDKDGPVGPSPAPIPTLGSESLKEIGASAHASPAKPLAFKSFQAGFAERDITPETTLALAGYGTYTYPFSKPRENSEGTHDPLKAGAVAFGAPTGVPFLLVGVDAVGLSAPSIQRIRKRIEASLGSNKFHFVVSASHTHSAPDTLGLWGALPLTGRNAEYMERLESGVAEAAVGAFRAMVPARVASARGTAPNGTSALDGVRKDDSFVYVSVRDLQGKDLGTITQWAAHPSVLKEKNNTVSADFIGAYRHFLGEKVAGIHVYVNGAIGNVYPVESSATVEDPFDSGAHDPDLGNQYSIAASVARDLLARVESAEASTESVEGIEVCRVSLAMPISNGTFLQAVSARVVEHEILDGSAPTEVSLTKLGGLRFAAMPAEVFPSVGNEIRGLLGGEGITVVPMGLANDWLGYVMSEMEMAEAGLAYWKRLSPSPEAGRLLVEAFAAAAKGKECQ